MSSATLPAQPIEFGRAPLIVIGAGPTGTAALFHAALEGLGAIGLEAGETPLADVHRYQRQLTLLSPSAHYEVAGIPLDSRSPSAVTREEVLSYYARLIRFGRLDIRCRHRCVGLEPQGGEVLVRVEAPEGAGIWRAENVLVTTWFRARQPPASWFRWGLTVLTSVEEPSRLAGRRVVLLGGGVSACEQAVALMHAGQPVTVVARGKLSPAFANDAIEEMVEATGSRLIEGAEDLAVEPRGVVFRLAGQPACEVIPCDVVVACLGRELCPDTAYLLTRAGVVASRDLAAIESAIERFRTGPRVPGAIGRMVAEWPDFWEQLVDGSRGIRIAGGGLHIGGGGAGVHGSIFLSYLAIQAILRRPFPESLAPPLPAAIWKARLPEFASEVRRWFDRARGFRFDLVADVCPLAIRSWTRIGCCHRSTSPCHARAATCCRASISIARAWPRSCGSPTGPGRCGRCCREPISTPPTSCHG
jgi:thioredoxin reductase